MIADSRRALRVLDTSHPPVYYVPPDDVAMQHLTETSRESICEWKSPARSYAIEIGDVRVENGTRCYPDPTPEFEALLGYLALYAGPMDGCCVDDERARPQPGDLYDGWITSEIEGPFQAGPGTRGW